MPLKYARLLARNNDTVWVLNCRQSSWASLQPSGLEAAQCSQMCQHALCHCHGWLEFGPAWPRLLQAACADTLLKSWVKLVWLFQLDLGCHGTRRKHPMQPAVCSRILKNIFCAQHSAGLQEWWQLPETRCCLLPCWSRRMRMKRHPELGCIGLSSLFFWSLLIYSFEG